MKMKFYCLYDTLNEEYNPPFCVKNDNVAKFSFATFVHQNRKQGKNEKEIPDLYSFNWYFNSETGEIMAEPGQADMFPHLLLNSKDVEGENKDASDVH